MIKSAPRESLGALSFFWFEAEKNARIKDENDY
jgi:hypothetical protein